MAQETEQKGERKYMGGGGGTQTHMNCVLEMEGGGLKPKRKKVKHVPMLSNVGNVILNGKEGQEGVCPD